VPIGIILLVCAGTSKSKVENVAVYIVLGVDLDGQSDVLGYWLGDGAAPRRQPANF
jgi:hypothetical protein